VQSESTNKASSLNLLMKFVAAAMLAAVMLLAGLLGGKEANAAESKIFVSYDGNELEFAVEPNLSQGTTLVQMRPLLEALGMELTWDPVTRNITAVKDGYELFMTLGSDIAVLNGQQIKLLRPAEAINGHTIVPLRFISEATGAFVHWNGVGREIVVMSEAYITGFGMTMQEMKVYVDQLQKEIDEQYAKEMADKKKKEEEAKNKPKPKPLDKVDESKLQGMFYGFENDFGGYECGGMCWKYYTFLPGKKVVVGEPAGGGPETIDCKTDNCQTYSIKDSKLVISGGDSLSIGQTEEGTIVINDAYMSKVEAVADNFKLDGVYVARGYTGLVGISPAASSWSKYLTFKADGIFTSDSLSIGVLSTGSSHTSGSTSSGEVTGTYSITGNTITLKYSDGKTTKHVFIPDEQEGDIYRDLQIGSIYYSLDDEE